MDLTQSTLEKCLVWLIYGQTHPTIIPKLARAIILLDVMVAQLRQEQ